MRTEIVQVWYPTEDAQRGGDHFCQMVDKCRGRGGHVVSWQQSVTQSPQQLIVVMAAIIEYPR